MLFYWNQSGSPPTSSVWETLSHNNIPTILNPAFLHKSCSEHREGESHQKPQEAHDKLSLHNTGRDWGWKTMRPGVRDEGGGERLLRGKDGRNWAIWEIWQTSNMSETKLKAHYITLCFMGSVLFKQTLLRLETSHQSTAAWRLCIWRRICSNVQETVPEPEASEEHWSVTQWGTLLPPHDVSELSLRLTEIKNQARQERNNHLVRTFSFLSSEVLPTVKIHSDILSLCAAFTVCQVLDSILELKTSLT